MSSDWREALLHGATRLDVRAAGRNLVNWPDYQPQPAVRAWQLPGSPDAPGAVVVTWDFSVQGGSFGEDDATVLQKASAHAVRLRVPLVTLVRTGGTRLQEGVGALVGIPRAVLALQALSAAGLAHVSVADAPTTGGVWVGVVSGADLRAGVDGATVGFAGPRVVQALTGSAPGPDSHTAASAFAAGLLDAVLPSSQMADWVRATLATLSTPPSANAHPDGAPPDPARAELPRGSGWSQVERSRASSASGTELLTAWLTDLVPLRAPRGDSSVTAYVGRFDGQPVVGVALAAERGGHPTANGYRLATRAYQLAGRLHLPVLSLVDTPGADPGPVAERDGLAPAMAEAMAALLTCPSPTVALVHGEGGSGGALAAAVADVVILSSDAYFAPMGPEGAAVALRRSAQDCADLMGITPADLLGLGFADQVAEPAGAAAALARAVRTLSAVPGPERLAARTARWSAPLPGPSSSA